MYHFNIKAIGEDRGQGVLAAIDGAGLELLYVRGLTPSHRSGVVESLTARFAWQEDDHYGHEKKEVA